MTRAAALVLVTCGALACLSLGDDHGEVSLWEANLVPDGGSPDFSGQVAVVSAWDGSTVGIAVEGAEPGAEHAWGLRLGTCASPGRQIGSDSDYPLLTVLDAGTAETQAYLGFQLATASSYHVDVRVSPTQPGRVACGNLVEVERDSL